MIKFLSIVVSAQLLSYAAIVSSPYIAHAIAGGYEAPSGGNDSNSRVKQYDQCNSCHFDGKDGTHYATTPSHDLVTTGPIDPRSDYHSTDASAEKYGGGGGVNCNCSGSAGGGGGWSGGSPIW